LRFSEIAPKPLRGEGEPHFVLSGQKDLSTRSRFRAKRGNPRPAGGADAMGRAKRGNIPRPGAGRQRSRIGAKE